MTKKDQDLIWEAFGQTQPQPQEPGSDDANFDQSIEKLFNEFWLRLPPGLQNPASKQSLARGFKAGFKAGFEIAPQLGNRI